MDKPIIFLSHSSKNKDELIKLKELLDRRAAGAIQFFLSSDGESIPLGPNWVVPVSDALAKAKLMFVFLSRQSIDSKWLHFEAGYAYSKKIRVVPVCLPELQFHEVLPPLSLLQGFNLHSCDAMANLARVCNETLGLRMDEHFPPEEFDRVFSAAPETFSFFGSRSEFIAAVSGKISSSLTQPSTADPRTKFPEICSDAQVDCLVHQIDPRENKTTLETCGCILSVQELFTVPPDGSSSTTTHHAGFSVECTLAPELFHVNAPLIDQLCRDCGLTAPQLTIEFEPLLGEYGRHKFTTKLYKTNIRVVGQNKLAFENIEFELFLTQRQLRVCLPEFQNPWIQRVVARLFAARILVPGSQFELGQI